MTLSEEVSELRQRVVNLEKIVSQLSNGNPKLKPKVKREPSAYNKFMSEELKKLKFDNPGVKQADLMKMVATKWKEAKTQ